MGNSKISTKKIFFKMLTIVVLASLALSAYAQDFEYGCAGKKTGAKCYVKVQSSSGSSATQYGYCKSGLNGSTSGTTCVANNAQDASVLACWTSGSNSVCQFNGQSGVCEAQSATTAELSCRVETSTSDPCAGKKVDADCTIPDASSPNGGTAGTCQAAAGGFSSLTCVKKSSPPPSPCTDKKEGEDCRGQTSAGASYLVCVNSRRMLAC